MKVHIFTLNWNGGDKLLNLYKSLVSYGKSLDIIWHIRDNGSKDKSIDFIQNISSPLEIREYRIEHNRDNFAKGMNYLCEQATPDDDDVILLLNNDVEFKDETSINKMYGLMLKTGAAIVGARLLYTGTNKLQHAGVIFSNRYGTMPYHYRHGEASDKHAAKNRYFQAVTAAVSLVQAKEFKRVNGFDERFNWAFDDIDLNFRIARNNNKIVYCGETNIYHDESASLRKNNLNKLFIGKNVKLFKECWAGKYEIDHDKYLKDSNYGLV